MIKKLRNDEGLLEWCTTNGFTFTHIGRALLAEFSVICALLMNN
jgi:hypothetical protein